MTSRTKKKLPKDKDPDLEALEFLKKDIEAELKKKESLGNDNYDLEKRYYFE